MPIVRFFCLATFALGLAGCAQFSTVPPLSIGPVEPSAETFERVQTIVAARGYAPRTNASRGTLRFTSSQSRPNARYSFTVQCYREGWVSVIPHGPRVRRVGDSWVMPSRLRREYLDLAVALAESVRTEREQ